MTLSEAIRERQGRRAVRANRDHSERVERRVDEIATVREVETDYAKVDRAGDIAIEGHFQSLYALVDTEDEKRAVAAAYAVWVRSERDEDAAVSGSVDEAVELLKANNPYWLDSETVA